VIVASKKARFFAWRDHLGRVRSKLSSTTRNARHIQRLLREPRTIGPEAVASLVQTVNLVVEVRCNIRCSCCHYFATRDDGTADVGADLPQMLKLVDEVPHAIVAITGGEPLMSPARRPPPARALLNKNRAIALVTNSLPLSDPRRGDLTRGILLQGLNEAQRSRLRVQCSLDIQHQQASRLSVDEYVRRCQHAIQQLTLAGFPVFTRSIVTSRDEYRFFEEHVLPLSRQKLTLGASLQPDVYDLPKFVAALAADELGDMASRLGSSYLRRIQQELPPPTGDGLPLRRVPSVGTLRTAPWAFIEINDHGVRGPSSFVANGTHHASVLAMLRSYDWLAVADSIVPQITITQNAFFYRVDRDTRTVTVNLPHVLRKLMQRRHLSF
jgi:hypothetical protein